MKMKQIIAVVFISAVTTVLTMWGYRHFAVKDQYVYQGSSNDSGKIPTNYAKFMDGFDAGAALDFTPASSAAIPATVHIKTKTNRTASNNLPRRNPFADLFDMDMDFFGERSRSLPQSASGSGAIISEDGYIVTNNHVVAGADEINVTLSNKKSFKAKVIGADPASDLAVIKIEAKNLPFLVYGNSDEVKVGQWVLAIGYPLTLETTVTAGIVSAKGRTLEINRRQSDAPVESFIQTDAAVNPGNSGGPLVTTDGKLIGINSAIASPTGAYAGYSFTIPVNIVKKIISDLMKFGTVQRAYLGIEYAPENVPDEIKARDGIEFGEGVYVVNVRESGAAVAAGIKKGDVITKVNGVPVLNAADMVGQIATYRPGDKINITYRRGGKEITAPVTLKNISGTTEIVKTSAIDKLGASFKDLSKEGARELGVAGGVVVAEIKGGIMSKVRVQEGYVILKANGKEVKSVDEFAKVIDGASGSVKLEGMYLGYEGIHTVVINL